MLSQIIILLLFLFSLLHLARCCLHHRSKRATVNPAVRFDVMSAAKAVLEPPKATLQALLTSRAEANQRLRRAFELTNTFVNDDAELHRSFVAQARDLIQAQSSLPARAAFAEMCSAVISDYISGHVIDGPVYFGDIVQVVTFKVILCSLFGADLCDLKDEDVLFAARTINSIWQLSKQPNTTSPPHLLYHLNTLLRGWLPLYANPLDFIIPTYETMWRVVAITIALVHRHGDQALLESFTQFLDNPSRQQFQHWSAVGETSVEAVVHEVIRLHPPTRRISRVASLSHSSGTPSDDRSPSFFSSIFSLFAVGRQPIQTTTLVADIGALHRNPTIWGSTSTEFDPTRFHPSKLTDAQKQCILGFGYGRLKCVAKDWAPHTAALIAAAVLGACGPKEEYEIVEGGAVGGREGWEGWNVVKKEEELVLV
ncbi:hypothetical protein EUX98_g2308 [Antrodiella citrinella]|uniref:Cytochrome P450 n=1 Tax=Antrodiella citrinella TaxID=2447956 RepID=A0A4S4N1I6_9APHY|nr:hypothetical protein EUX98_g2308 [Antrodiella citrinella]